ncbi:uncharacterized protein LOC142364068 [Opisthocomus hoazin]|uniref:uncharacterized protein LOC142364068 n=1 Tax=Opisthocomus hoazin TaxID=30419 RepID=UPI003F5369E3
MRHVPSVSHYPRAPAQSQRILLHSTPPSFLHTSAVVAYGRTTQTVPSPPHTTHPGIHRPAPASSLQASHMPSLPPTTGLPNTLSPTPSFAFLLLAAFCHRPCRYLGGHGHSQLLSPQLTPEPYTQTTPTHPLVKTRACRMQPHLSLGRARLHQALTETYKTTPSTTIPRLPVAGSTPCTNSHTRHAYCYTGTHSTAIRPQPTTPRQDPSTPTPPPPQRGRSVLLSEHHTATTDTLRTRAPPHTPNSCHTFRPARPSATLRPPPSSTSATSLPQATPTGNTTLRQDSACCSHTTDTRNRHSPASPSPSPSRAAHGTIELAPQRQMPRPAKTALT